MPLDATESSAPRRIALSTTAASGVANAIPSILSRIPPPRAPGGMRLTTCDLFETSSARRGKWTVLDHGEAPRIGPRFLWQAKQRPPSTIYN